MLPEEIAVENIEASTSTAEKAPKLQQSKKVKKTNEPPRGQPKSGRPWKDQKEKFLKVKKSLYRRPLKKKMQLREELKHIKDLSRSIKDQRVADNEEKKKRREENAAKKLENQRKSEVVQIVKNASKLKRMKKKQLRMIEKRDLDTIKTV